MLLLWMKFINSNDRFVRKEYKISLSESTSNRTIDSGMLEEEFSVVDEGPEETQTQTIYLE